MPGKKFSFVVVYWWMVGCLMLGCFLCAFAPRESRASDAENRMLAGLPPLCVQSVLNCDFMNGVESFLSDGFFGREKVIATVNAARSLLDMRTEQDALLLDDATVEELTGLPAAYDEDPLGDGASPDEADLFIESVQDGGGNGDSWTDDSWIDDSWIDDSWSDDSWSDDSWTDDQSDGLSQGTDGGQAGWDGAKSSPEGRKPFVSRSKEGGPASARRGRAIASAPGSEAPLKGSLFLNDSVPASPRPTAAFDRSASYALWLERPDGRRDNVVEYPVKAIEYTAETLRLYRAALPEDGTVHYVNVPLATIAERIVRRQAYASWGSNMEVGLQALVGEGVYVYNVADILKEHILAGEPVYMTIDHHWTPLGAYYTCAQMLRAQGLPVLPYDECSYDVYPSVAGAKNTVDALELLVPLQPTHSYVVSKRTRETEIRWMDPETRTYRAFLNGTHLPWRRIETGFHSGRKALVVCDSFGNAFAPYLLPYYDEVHMADPRAKYFNRAQAGGSISELIDYFHIDDVYIIVCTHNGVSMRTSSQYQRANFLP